MGRKLHRTKRRRYTLETAPTALHPYLRAELAARRIDLLRVEVIDAQQVIIHNSREWR